MPPYQITAFFHSYITCFYIYFILGLYKYYTNLMVKMMSDSKKTSLLIQLESDLKQSFASVCASQDQTVSQVLRKFMRDYIKTHAQQDLFIKK